MVHRHHRQLESGSEVQETSLAPEKGFETIYTSQGYHQWSIVEALFANGNRIRNSSRVVGTFVPGEELAAVCDEGGCPSATAHKFSADGGEGATSKGGDT